MDGIVKLVEIGSIQNDSFKVMPVPGIELAIKLKLN